MKKLIIPDCAYFLTTRVNQGYKIFADNGLSDILIKNPKYYRQIYRFSLWAYVIMPDHLHMVIKPKEAVQIPVIMRDFKKYTAMQIIDILARQNSRLLADFKVKNNAGRHYQIWQNNYYSVCLDRPGLVEQKINYIHLNPVRQGLVRYPEEYKFSSARNYYLGDNTIIKINQTDLF